MCVYVRLCVQCDWASRVFIDYRKLDFFVLLNLLFLRGRRKLFLCAIEFLMSHMMISKLMEIRQKQLQQSSKKKQEQDLKMISKSKIAKIVYGLLIPLCQRIPYLIDTSFRLFHFLEERAKLASFFVETPPASQLARF